MYDLHSRVAARYVLAVRYASAVLTPEYVEEVLKELHQGNAPDAFRRLQQFARDLRNDNLAPFPVVELAAFLRERDVPEDEIDLVGQVRVRAPKTKREVSFTDAIIQFGGETGVSVVPDMRFEDDPEAAKAVLGWLAGFKKLKAPARKVWDRAVRKVHLGKPRGSEDASWRSGGLLDLTVNRVADPKVRTTQLTHELGHAFEELHHIGGEPPWGQAPFVSDYAEFRPGVEDVAESFRAFIEEPLLFRKKCPDKYEVVKSLI